ncbi:hypothetical protein BPC006_II2760 [Burkholderia pseudomallei BPC006]|nr:hypothetical protein BPC006_II2760 [Burkholderia pseudomallei BPC006]KGX68158.1 hypothetical protein Y026_5403 [Burkholderia pseudomallei TSV28]
MAIVKTQVKPAAKLNLKFQQVKLPTVDAFDINW